MLDSPLQAGNRPIDTSPTEQSALDVALLRRFEPILRFTRGEQFFPADVERYVRQASLWFQRPGEDAICVLERGEVTLETLGQVDMGRPDAVYFLKFTEPLDSTDLAAYRAARRRNRDIFVPGTGRLARVGYASRFVDALFNVTLLARGRVPGDTAAAAALTYTDMLNDSESYQYHGRVVRESGWIVLQYWFFYVYNNWRSGFSGANDHEADWELIMIYLAETDDDVVGENGDGVNGAGDGDPFARYRPEWVAYASHDYAGDDLRRRWDDAEVDKEGTHPVVYVAAGSHGSYFQRGEYLTELEIAFLHRLATVADVLVNFWHNQLRQYAGEFEGERSGPATNFFRIPFVDYARGDGLSIGPGQVKKWAPPRLLRSEEGWLSTYRGLWGLYARDPFAGENAPAGPMYNRDRTLRRAWYDPVGWAGLDKVPTPDEEVRMLAAHQVDLRARQSELRDEIQRNAFALRNLGITMRAMRNQPHLQLRYNEYQRKLASLSDDVAALRRELAENQALLHTLEGYTALARAGMREPPRAHIRRAHVPTADEQFRAGRLAEVWAAASIGLMLVVFVALIYFARHFVIFGLAAMLSLFAFVEASFRGRIVRMVTSLTVGLAVVAALVLLFEFFWQFVALAVLTIGSYLLWENLRELWQ